MRRLLHALWRDDRGVSALEFALVTPIIIVLLAATVDFGLVLKTRSSMESAVSSTMSYALSQAQDLKPAEAVAFVETVARIASRQSGEGVAVEVTLNRSLVARAIGGSVAVSGTAAAASACYCPDRAETAVNWGEAKTCNAPCPDGGYAGRFLKVSANQSYAPIFVDFGLVTADAISVETLAGLQ
jgi:Flp pilus assembly protein TadG